VLCFYCRVDNPSQTGKSVLIACSTTSFPQESLESALRRIAWAGFSAIELDVSGSGLPDPSELRLRLHAEGLETAAVYAGSAPSGGSESAFDDWAQVGRAASLARDLDCPQVIIAGPDSGSLADLRQGVSLLDKALGALPVEVCLVNRWGTLLASPEQMSELCNFGLPARIRWALDPAQAELAGWDPLDHARLPSPPAHLYWNDLRSGNVVPPGEGELPLFALADSLMGATPPPRSLTVSLQNADPWQVEPLAREIYRQTLVQFEIPESP
jgi:sugar phosphate isomerase/epimerase